jgi:hypothetical protein
MASGSRAIGASANWKTLPRALSVRERYLLADVDEDLPVLNALQFENAAYEPWVVL